MKVTIVDYNSGNISSVINSFKEVAKNKVNIEVTSDLKKIKSSDKVVLPGQGSFKSCVDALNKINGLIDTLNEFAISNKKPLLGICVGLQMFADIGYEESETKGLGWITTVVFTLLGGVMAMRAGTIKTMFFAGGLMALTNLLFAVLAWTGKSEILFAIAVIADDITAAFATVAFVAFISLLVDRTYTATQYALLASIGTAGRTTLASSSGALVDWLNGDWGTFFVLTTIMVIPSLICLWLIKNKIKIGAK